MQSRSVPPVDDDEWEDSFWTDESRAAYVRAAEQAMDVLRFHIAAVTAATEHDIRATFELSEQVQDAFSALGHAEFNLTACSSPFSPLVRSDWTEEEDDDNDEPDPLDASAEHNQLSVFIRRDYRLTSEAAVLDAGRDAYARVWPDDPAEAAAEDVTHLGRAIYQITHAGGFEALDDLAGLDPTAGIVLTVGRTETLSGDELQTALKDPASLFVVDGVILHSQVDIW